MLPQLVRLRPALHSRTRMLAHPMTARPASAFLDGQEDPFTSWHARLAFPERTARIVVEMAAVDPFDFFAEEVAETWPSSTRLN